MTLQLVKSTFIYWFIRSTAEFVGQYGYILKLLGHVDLVGIHGFLFTAWQSPVFRPKPRGRRSVAPTAAESGRGGTATGRFPRHFRGWPEWILTKILAKSFLWKESLRFFLFDAHEITWWACFMILEKGKFLQLSRLRDTSVGPN